jgi:NAD(P)-dependent dehydrogenase (short-subunit alcohol dehydrogenase family)
VSGRRAVVTGSASGMGAATATALRQEGWEVVGVDLRDADIVADLGSSSDRRRVAEEVAVRCDGRLDAAVTCAGISGFTSAGGDVVLAVDYFGTVDLLASLRPLLAAGSAAAAVAISSNAATITPRLDEALIDACIDADDGLARDRARQAGAAAAYAAAKFAVARWVRRSAPTSAWIGQGITLNAVVPGMIDTPMTRSMQENVEATSMLERTPLPAGRPGTPEEIAGVVGFLLGPSARFLVGSLLFVDGGTDAVIRGDHWPSPRPSRRQDPVASPSADDA